MMYDAFISYSIKDAFVAEAAKHFLEAKGIRCWKAPDNILPGQIWEEAIAAALPASQCMLLIWSANSQDSLNVKRELSLAASLKKIIIPFRIDVVEPAGVFAYYLTNTHWLDRMNDDIEKDLELLCEQFHRILPMLGEARACTSVDTPANIIIPCESHDFDKTSVDHTCIEQRDSPADEHPHGKMSFVHDGSAISMLLKRFPDIQRWSNLFTQDLNRERWYFANPEKIMHEAIEINPQSRYCFQAGPICMIKLATGNRGEKTGLIILFKDEFYWIEKDRIQQHPYCDANDFFRDPWPCSDDVVRMADIMRWLEPGLTGCDPEDIEAIMSYLDDTCKARHLQSLLTAGAIEDALKVVSSDCLSVFCFMESSDNSHDGEPFIEVYLSELVRCLLIFQQGEIERARSELMRLGSSHYHHAAVQSDQLLYRAFVDLKAIICA